METNAKQVMRVAVKCKNCTRTIFYKTTPLSGIIELKCPRCQKVAAIKLAHRRSKTPIFYRQCTSIPSNSNVF